MNYTQQIPNMGKLNKSMNNIKGNGKQITTQKQSNKQLLMQILGGSTSVRNQDHHQLLNSNQASGHKGAKNSSGFFSNNTPGSAKGNLTNREQTNILFELIQNNNPQKQGKGSFVQPGTKVFENTQPVGGLTNFKNQKAQPGNKQKSASRQPAHQKQNSVGRQQAEQQFLSPQQQPTQQLKAKKISKEEKQAKRDYASPTSGAKPPASGGSFKPPML